MAILKNVVSKEEVLLLPLHTFGRRSGFVNTVVSPPSVSQNHATIHWDGERWIITDHSRNGTWVNDKLLHRSVPNNVTRAELTKGCIVCLCEADESCSWQVISVEAPVPQLLPMPMPTADVSDQVDLQAIPLNVINALPSEECPEKTLRRSASGAWVLESADDVLEIKDGDIIQIGQYHWQLHCSGSIEQTLEMRRTDSAVMEFGVSLDEEHIVVRLNNGGEVLNFGERVHHYVLLLLARKWLEDHNRGFDAQDCGWLSLDGLAALSGVQPASLNMQIFRLRKQFVDHVIKGTMPPVVIERRRGEIRFAYPRFKILRASQLEGEAV